MIYLYDFPYLNNPNRGVSSTRAGIVSQPGPQHPAGLINHSTAIEMVMTEA